MENLSIYNDGTGKPKSESIFIWIDILGFSSIVENETSYRELYELLKLFQSKFTNKIENNYQSSIISDGIIIEILPKHHNNIPIELEKIFRDIAEMQFNFIIETEYFIRGGIANGTKFYNDDENNMFISNGLARAYNLESSNICWPIIGISKKYKENLQKFFKGYKDSFNLSHTLNNYGEDIYFIDFLLNKTKDELDQYKQLINNKVKQYKDNPKILPKYIWLYKHLNRFYPGLKSHEDYQESVL